MACEKATITLPDPRDAKNVELTWEQRKLVTELYEVFVLPEILSVPRAGGKVMYVNVCDSGCA